MIENNLVEYVNDMINELADFEETMVKGIQIDEIENRSRKIKFMKSSGKKCKMQALLLNDPDLHF